MGIHRTAAIIVSDMISAQDSDWLEARLKQRAERRKKERLEKRNPNLPVIDAGKFTVPLAELAITLTNKVEREGPQAISQGPIPVDTGVILRQLTHTFNLLRFINGDETRFENPGYRQAYSFVSLPLVRTMIDGFYNCTALLDDPSRARIFRISGYYRLRESLRADEAKYANDPLCDEYLTRARANLDLGMRVESLTDADLDTKANRWPLLGEYLGRRPDTPHKQMLRKLTLGFWREYSSVSHASFDGLVMLFPFIAGERAPHEKREQLPEAAERYIGMHIGRASGILLCLLTEIQHFYRFDGAEIGERLGKIWEAILPIPEVRELYDYRYRELLAKPVI